jgi:hypothetical protein
MTNIQCLQSGADWGQTASPAIDLKSLAIFEKASIPLKKISKII